MYRPTEYSVNAEQILSAWNASDEDACSMHNILSETHEPVRAFYGPRSETEPDIRATACGLVAHLVKKPVYDEVYTVAPYCIFGETGEVAVRGVALWVRR